MNIKQQYGLWLAIISIASGVWAASFRLEQGFLPAPDDFTPLNLLRWILIFSGISFLSLLLLIFLAKLGRNFFRWLFSWRILKRCLLALGIFLALIPIFYAEEDWRGKHAWEKFKQEWEAHGEKFDFASFIPPPVPDEQNFAFAPIVASAYRRVMDKSGHRIQPEDTNVVNRLALDLYRTSPLDSSNLSPLGWRVGTFTDLPAWQNYYRTMFVTNHHPAGMDMLVNPYRPPDLPASPPSPAVNSFPNPQDTNDILDVEALNTRRRCPVGLEQIQRRNRRIEAGRAKTAVEISLGLWRGFPGANSGSTLRGLGKMYFRFKSARERRTRNRTTGGAG
jgi:hypothetical protein